MSYLGMVHDTSTVTAMKATLDADADALRAQRRTAADEVRDAALAAGEDVGACGVVLHRPRGARLRGRTTRDGVLIGACRADALAATDSRHHRRDR